MRTLIEELEDKKIEYTTYWDDEIRVEYRTITDLSLDRPHEQRIKFWNCNFDNLRVTWVVSNLEFYGCTFNDCNFEDVEFENCDFRHCSWKKGSLREATIEGKSFRNCTMSEVNMRGVTFEGIHEMGENRFQDCDLMRASFSKCHLTNSWFEANRLNNCDFNRCNLTASSFYQNYGLVNCDFYGSYLNKVKGMALLEIAGYEAILDHKEMKVGCTTLQYEDWEEDKKHREYLFDTKSEMNATVALVRANKRVIQAWVRSVKKELKRGQLPF